MDKVLVAIDLRKSFGDLVAVDGVSFHIEAGETLGLATWRLRRVITRR